MFVFFFIKYQWITILNVFGYIMLEIGSNISSNPFLKLTLHMSWIVIFHRIMSPFMDSRCDKVTYMLHIFKCILLGGCQRSIIKFSNVSPCVLQYVKQKVEARGN